MFHLYTSINTYPMMRNFVLTYSSIIFYTNTEYDYDIYMHKICVYSCVIIYYKYLIDYIVTLQISTLYISINQVYI